MAPVNPEEFLRELFAAAVKAAQPVHCLPPVLSRISQSPVSGRTVVVGAGKAAASMAQVLEAHYSGSLEGLVVTRYGHIPKTGARCKSIEVVEAAHPVPDKAGRDAAARMLGMVSNLTAQDLVICLISGGGSALLSLPAPGLSLADKQAVNKALLASGASIGEMNCLRKHLSAVKGGRLALAALPAKVITLAISDVPGDDPAVIASGPAVPDPTTREEARDILSRYGISAPDAVSAYLERAESETPKPGDAAFLRAETHLIATPQGSLEAAAEVARKAGVTPLILGDAIEGEAREVAIMHGGIARQIARHQQPVKPPAVILSGGETTVTLRATGTASGTASGRGGRNAEFLLSLAIYLGGQRGIYALAADTDGIDGSEDNAGAVISPDILARAKAVELDARAMLAGNDAYSFFDGLGALLKTGPTLTNVNDFRAIYIE